MNKKILIGLLGISLLISVISCASMTPLMQASEAGDLEKVRSLLAEGADVYASGSDGFTALFEAVLNGHTEIVRLLLEHQAEVDVKVIMNRTLLHDATVRGYLDIIRLLIDHGADINVRDGYKLTPLHIAAYHGYSEIACLLLAKGARIGGVNTDGDTALQMAKDQDHTVIVEMIQQAEKERIEKIKKETK